MNPVLTSTDVAPEGAWFKSSYSGAEGNSCIEIAPLNSGVGIRDSKDKEGPALVVSHTTWAAFVRPVRSGHLGI
ncbi:DUF397 domain-containing protein [Streptomyces sp. ASQP_92]|uniref:DUF397 domain-containing protein n=1 Tax=Streptomyces sp. ASQP_92 TaxID=2979116 RepID=UPI0021C1DF5F|nr:DUF397 domain-containing protein [Streptomyces sp. ASQP_92]MCT9093494.1 DUF397 domain-containing protein [Streptomyces sp. ASQP_92]